jgi:membrane protein YqaA with SNARE-associated domain
LSALVILFLWSFAAATVLPLSSEVPLALAINQTGGWPVPVLIATLGNYLGACTTFYLARAAAARLQVDARPRARHAAALLRRFGAPALLLSWVPLVGDVMVALAGAARVPFGWFSFWVILGKGARYLAVAWLTLQW